MGHKLKPSVRNKYQAYIADKQKELKHYERLAKYATDLGIPFGPVSRKMERIERDIADAEFYLEQHK